jgi:hypothetical protein
MNQPIIPPRIQIILVYLPHNQIIHVRTNHSVVQKKKANDLKTKKSFNQLQMIWTL